MAVPLLGIYTAATVGSISGGWISSVRLAAMAVPLLVIYA
jgi:hypothetical protein